MSGDVHVRFCERLGVRFPRATHRNVYVRSLQAGQRVMASISRFVETRLRLKVNAAKSAVAPPWQRKFLGFSFTGPNTPQPARRIAPQAPERFRRRVRAMTWRRRGVSIEQIVEELTSISPDGAGTLASARPLGNYANSTVGCAGGCGRLSGNSGNGITRVIAN